MVACSRGDLGEGYLVVLNFKLRKAGALLAAATVAFSLAGASVQAQDTQTRTVVGERYVPTIWVDPDGCEHWVMDDGWEGFMTPHVKRDGRPVCHNGNKCASLNSDQLFGTSGSNVSAANRQRLIEFFTTVDAKSFIINGYTDSRGSARRNLKLSQRRANAVAQIAADANVPLLDVRGYGETSPKGNNKTSAGRAENRRVEIICVH